MFSYFIRLQRYKTLILEYVTSFPFLLSIDDDNLVDVVEETFADLLQGGRERQGAPGPGSSIQKYIIPFFQENISSMDRKYQEIN